MIDMQPKTIQRLFQQQVLKLTAETVISKEDTFDFQLSGGWIP